MFKTSSNLRIVLVQENENDRLLFRRAFQKSDVSCDIVECSRAEEALERLGADLQSFDVVVVDHNLTDISGMDLCIKLLDKKISVPLVLLAETGSEKIIADAIKAGVHDYIIKDPENGYLELLPISLIKAICQCDYYHTYCRTKETIQSKKTALSFLESIPDIAATIDTDGNILMINKAGAESLDRSVDEIIGKNLSEILSGDVYTLRQSKWNQVIQTGKICHFEDVRDGKYFEIWFCPIFDSKGKVEFISAFAHDITEHKNTEKALRHSEEKFRLAMEATNDALWDWNMVTNEVYRNPRHATMSGYESKELTSSQHEWEKRIHPDDKKAVFQILDEYFAGKRDLFEIEYRLMTKSGEYKWVLGRGKVVAYNDDGSPARMIGTNIDITERKKAEEVLNRSEKLFRDIFENTTIGMYRTMPDGRILVANRALVRMLGFSSFEELSQRNLEKEGYEPCYARSVFKDRIEKDGQIVGLESQWIKKDGTMLFVNENARVVRDESGKTLYYEGTAEDITQRKKAEQATAEYQTLIRGIMDNAGSIVVVRDLHGRYLMVNKEVEKVLGIRSEQIIGKTPYDIHSKDKANNILADDKRVIKSRKLLEIEDQIDVHGETRTFLGTKFPLLNSSGEVYTVCTVATDITEHRQAEEEIRKFKTIADKAGHGVGIVDLEGNLVYVNDSFAQMHQYRVDELIGINLSVFHNEQQMERVNQLNEQLKREGSYVAEEVWHKKRDDTVFPTLMSGTLLRDKSGEPLFMAATAVDITKHKKAEEALKESELRYRTLFEILPVGVGLSTPVGRIIDANSTFQQMIGYSTEEMKRINVHETYHNPQERDPYMKQLQQEGFVHGFEVQLKRKDGTIFLASINATTMKIRDETVIVTVAKDITEQKWMEKALAESEEKYRTLVECARDPIATIDKNGTYLFMNKTAVKRLTGRDEDLAGKTLWDFFPKEIADRHAANIRKVIETEKGANIISLTTIKGQARWYNTTIEPLRDDRGTVIAAIVIARDVDDIKRAEEQIKMLSSAVESSINGIAIGDAEGTLTYVNHAFLEMWGYDNENEVLGRNAIEFWQTKEQGQKILETIVNTGSWIGQMTAQKKDGSIFDVQVCGTLVKDDKGKPISMMGSFVDISEMKQKEEELSRYRGQMAHAEQLASLGTLSATVAHQLTQPLTVIRLSIDNALDELEASSSSENVIRRLKESVTQVSNITSIIENFRNFARKSSGRTVAEVNLKIVAVRIARLLSESARSSNVILRIRNMDDLPSPWMNENDIEQLFFALIENAIQAADGKKTRQLVISGAVKDKNIELRISDDCGGINPENIDKIFEPFFTTKPRGHGTGLGLCIVKDVVSRNGGRVKVESKLGKGTTFIISLPIDQGKIS